MPARSNPLQRTRRRLRNPLLSALIHFGDVVCLVDLFLNRIKINVGDSIVAIEESCEFFQGWSPGLNEVEVNENEFDCDPDLNRISWFHWENGVYLRYRSWRESIDEAAAPRRWGWFV